MNIKTQANTTTIILDGNTTGKGEVTLNKKLNMPEITKIAIKLIASDGTTETRYLEVMPDPRIYITGKIETENVNGEHISEITVYKLGDTKQEIMTVKTEEDGMFRILMYTPDQDPKEALDAKYELVISKDGYLDYIVTDITLIEKAEMDIGGYKLIAGDVIKTGEINIDDLVGLNDNYGITVLYENGIEDQYAKYDFNGDGVINLLDRIILKGNYGKKSEVVTQYELEQNSKQSR